MSNSYKHNKAWRIAHPDRYMASKKSYYARHAVNKKRSGFTWKHYEDELVLDRTLPDVLLSKLIERSVEAIQVRRSRLKKVTP